MFKKSFCVTVLFYLFLLGTIFFLMGFQGICPKEPAREPARKKAEIKLKTLSKGSARETTSAAGKNLLPYRFALKVADSITKEEAEETATDQVGGKSEPKAPQYEKEGDETIRYSEEEIRVLERIIEAEAGGEDADGKLLVANVVLNRVRDESFPNTITEVVFQKSNGVTQFSPVANGRYEAVTVSQESKDAAQRALRGEDLSDGALYFAARKHANPKSMQWFDQNLTLLFQHGGHEFFK